MIYLFNKFPEGAFHNGPFSRRSSAEVSRASSPTICLSTPKLPLPMPIPSTLQPTLRRSEAPAKRSRVSPGGPAAPRLLRPGGPPTLPRANVQSSVQPRGPGLGAENLHSPRSLAPPPGSLYASATTEKNRCRHLRIRSASVVIISLFSSPFCCLENFEPLGVGAKLQRAGGRPLLPPPPRKPGSLLPARSV